MSRWCNVEERCRLAFVLCLGETLTNAKAIILPPPSAPQISGSLQNHIEKKSLFVYGVSGSLRFVFLPPASCQHWKCQNIREAFLLELPAMVGRRRARNLRRNLLLIFPAQSCRMQGWGEFSKASGLLDANTACIPAGDVSLLLSIRTVARKVEVRGRTAERSRGGSHLLADFLCMKAWVHCVFSADVKAKASRSTFQATAVALRVSVMGCLFAAMCGLNQAPLCHLTSMFHHTQKLLWKQSFTLPLKIWGMGVTQKTSLILP